MGRCWSTPPSPHSPGRQRAFLGHVPDVASCPVRQLAMCAGGRIVPRRGKQPHVLAPWGSPPFSAGNDTGYCERSQLSTRLSRVLCSRHWRRRCKRSPGRRPRGSEALRWSGRRQPRQSRHAAAAAPASAAYSLLLRKHAWVRSGRTHRWRAFRAHHQSMIC